MPALFNLVTVIDEPRLKIILPMLLGLVNHPHLSYRLRIHKVVAPLRYRLSHEYKDHCTRHELILCSLNHDNVDTNFIYLHPPTIYVSFPKNTPVMHHPFPINYVCHP